MISDLKNKYQAEKLLVLVMDRWSELSVKGEVIERYYNPGELFKQVHVVLLNDDSPKKTDIQKMVGEARLIIHNIPIPKYIMALGWIPLVLKWWTRDGIRLAENINPDLIRCHGFMHNLLLARQIKEKIGVPYTVSIHINPDVNIWGPGNSLVDRVFGWLYERSIKKALAGAEIILPVYKPIIPFLSRLGLKNYEVAYNALNPSNLIPKTDYTISNLIRVISVGRQFKEKCPDKLIEAVAEIPAIELTLVGDGSHNEYLKEAAKRLRIGDRVKFITSVPNDQLVRMLHTFDIFATHSEYFEISKSVLEPLLVGLPVILNLRKGEQVPELQEIGIYQIENSKAGYKKALLQLIQNHQKREEYGKRCYMFARKNWDPAISEARFVDIYQRALNRNS